MAPIPKAIWHERDRQTSVPIEVYAVTFNWVWVFQGKTQRYSETNFFQNKKQALNRLNRGPKRHWPDPNDQLIGKLWTFRLYFSDKQTNDIKLR